MAARLGHAQARVVPMWQLKALVIDAETPQPVFLGADELAAESLSVFLGEESGVPYFALELSHLDEAEAARRFAGRGVFHDLRALGPRIDRRQGALLAYARAMMYWHQRHRFCGVCGAPTQSDQGGHVRHCTNAACKATHFPRTDPAVIMLVTLDDRCLLARQRQWPQGQHSTLAGFVEPGETLEQCVAREVMEEVSVRVTNLRYFASQPWPFPHSMMIAFHADYAGGEIHVDGVEIAEARWFDIDALPNLPGKISIARRLIENALMEMQGGSGHPGTS